MNMAFQVLGRLTCRFKPEADSQTYSSQALIKALLEVKFDQITL